MTAESKSLVNKDGGLTKLTEWATQDVDSVDAAIALFGDQGVSYSAGEEVTGDYRVITADEKQLFLERVAGERVFIVRWAFYEGSNGEFAAAHIIIDKHGKFILNDGAKGGIYGQLSKVTSNRISVGQTGGQEMAGLLAARGFKKNKPFFYDDRTDSAISRADLEKMGEEPCDCTDIKEKHTGEKHKKPARPTWKLEF